MREETEHSNTCLLVQLIVNLRGQMCERYIEHKAKMHLLTVQGN